MTSLHKKVAVVTGSTSGIGWAIAEALARAGARVLVHGLGEAAAIERRCRELARDTGSDVHYDAADLRRAEEAERLIEVAEQAWGTVDILVNNAGFQHVAPIEHFPAEKWAELQTVLLQASFHTIKRALPGMKQRGWGRLINLASAHGLVASPFKSAYVAAKHGLVGLTKAVALEVAESGITCNAICPGYVRTPLVEAQIAAQAEVHGLPREQVMRDVILSAQPTKRLIEPEEVAALTLYLCGDLARSITGAALAIDGGWTAR